MNASNTTNSTGGPTTMDLYGWNAPGWWLVSL